MSTLRVLDCYCLNQASWDGCLTPSSDPSENALSLVYLKLHCMCSVKTLSYIARQCPNLRYFSMEYLDIPDMKEKILKFCKKMVHAEYIEINRKMYVGERKEKKENTK
jgi:hypothetical protein